MPPIASTPRTPHRRPYDNFYAKWCEERRNFDPSASCPRKLASRKWKAMSEDEKAMYRIQPRESPELPHVTEPFDDLYEDEDLINNVVSLNDSPVKEEEQFPLSPLFSEFWSDAGPSAFDEFTAVDPSVLEEIASAGPSRVVLELPLPGPSSTHEAPVVGPSFTVDQYSLPTSSPSAGGPSVASPAPVPASTLTPTHLLATDNLVNGTDLSLFDAFAYDYPPVAEVTFPDNNWWDEASYTTDPTGTYGSDLPTPVPPTPTTGYTALQTPWYTPGLHTHDLPTGFDDTQFAFNNVGAVVPEQPTQNTYSECLPHLSVAPPTPAPASVPALAPVPEIAGQFGQMAGFPGDQYQWNGVTQTFENNQLLAPPPPLFNQNVPLPVIQQIFNAVGQDGKGFRLGPVGVQLWFTPV